jgi:GNAT superfamily N-acetyltransferase
MKVRVASPADAKRIGALIQALSKPFLVSPSGEGAEPFLASIGEAAIEGYISSPNFVYLVADCEGELAGVVALRDNSHLFHLFVAQRFQGRGWGRQLWQVVESAARQAGNPGRFTVNSSLNAVPVYERFGFVVSGPAVQTHGIAFQPMLLQQAENDA